MCWNAEVSLNTFIFGLLSAAIILFIDKTELKLVLILMSATLMQLVEFFAWRNIDNKEAIKTISLFGMGAILLQLILINSFNLKGNERIIVLTIIFISALIALNHIINNDKLKMEKGVNGHLMWYWTDVPLPLLIIFLSFYLYAGIRNKKILVIFSLATLLISLYTYYKYKTWGSMWCYISNIFWILLIAKVVFEYLYGAKLKIKNYKI
jgi:hypothetical protein